MKKIWEQIKKFCEAYKMFILIMPLISGAMYDRFVNMWNVPGRLDADERIFTETRKKDSVMYINDKIKQDSINKILLKKECACNKSTHKKQSNENNLKSNRIFQR